MGSSFSNSNNKSSAVGADWVLMDALAGRRLDLPGGGEFCVSSNPGVKRVKFSERGNVDGRCMCLCVVGRITLTECDRSFCVYRCVSSGVVYGREDTENLHLLADSLKDVLCNVGITRRDLHVMSGKFMEKDYKPNLRGTSRFSDTKLGRQRGVAVDSQRIPDRASQSAAGRRHAGNSAAVPFVKDSSSTAGLHRSDSVKFSRCGSAGYYGRDYDGTKNYCGRREGCRLLGQLDVDNGTVVDSVASRVKSAPAASVSSPFSSTSRGRGSDARASMGKRQPCRDGGRVVRFGSATVVSSSGEDRKKKYDDKQADAVTRPRDSSKKQQQGQSDRRLSGTARDGTRKTMILAPQRADGSSARRRSSSTSSIRRRGNGGSCLSDVDENECEEDDQYDEHKPRHQSSGYWSDSDRNEEEEYGGDEYEHEAVMF